jgi:hypothetical protein
MKEICYPDSIEAIWELATHPCDCCKNISQCRQICRKSIRSVCGEENPNSTTQYPNLNPRDDISGFKRGLQFLETSGEKRNTADTVFFNYFLEESAKETGLDIDLDLVYEAFTWIYQDDDKASPKPDFALLLQKPYRDLCDYMLFWGREFQKNISTDLFVNMALKIHSLITLLEMMLSQIEKITSSEIVVDKDEEDFAVAV